MFHIDSESSGAFPTSLGGSQGQNYGHQDSTIVKADDIVKLDIFEDMKVWGDLLFRLFHKGSLKNTFIWRLGVNTSYMEEGDNVFRIKDLDPFNFDKTEKIPSDFALNIVLEEGCKQCDEKFELDEFCRHWKFFMNREIEHWRIIKKILAYRESEILPTLT